MSQTGRAPDSRTIVRMTRTQTRTYGVIAPSRRQLLLAAKLRAFAWLLSNVVLLTWTIINPNTRDWQTGGVEDD